MVKKPNWHDVWDIVTQEVDTVIKQQTVAQGWAKNIRAGGDFSEVHFRNLLRKILPEGLGVTSGHIVSRVDKTMLPVVSPQCDIIIFDKMVPHSLLPFKQKGVEFDFTPIEAVVAVFETKTTLYNGKGNNSLFAACTHLKNILEIVALNPKQTGNYIPGGMKIESGDGINLKGGKTANPLIGILCCKTTKNFLKNANVRKYLDSITALLNPYRLDIVLSIDGRIIGPCDQDGRFIIDSARALEGQLMMQTAGLQNDLTPSQIVARGLGMILMYLQNTTGRHINPQDYLFY